MVLVICIPLEIYSFNDKAQSRTNGVDIFVHDSFHDRCLSGIVETASILSVAHSPAMRDCHTALVLASLCLLNEPCEGRTAFPNRGLNFTPYSK